ncbi:hypothetical protein AB833_24135 [Chromatiales bacterium (ex Bugula neritina AB1)]|nr:hypothetical protein AB833_24135 [Chromatiales bacterium (ex Bugula neritina AB1)]
MKQRQRQDTTQQKPIRTAGLGIRQWRSKVVKKLMRIKARALSVMLPLLMTVFSNPVQAETYYFHNDHLGTPQVLTDSNQQVVWKGEYDPFGAVTETVNQVEQNLRFPGQYFDRETGLHYNYFRTYDPGTGRYVESDPIGLGGGVNTYGYALSNPSKNVDRDGLIAIPFPVAPVAPRPITFPLDPVIPVPIPWELDDFMDDGDARGRICKTIRTVSSVRNSEGRYDLVCVARCEGGDVVRIKLNYFDSSCPHYIADSPAAHNTSCSAY